MVQLGLVQTARTGGGRVPPVPAPGLRAGLAERGARALTGSMVKCCTQGSVASASARARQPGRWQPCAALAAGFLQLLQVAP